MAKSNTARKVTGLGIFLLVAAGAGAVWTFRTEIRRALRLPQARLPRRYRPPIAALNPANVIAVGSCQAR